MTDETAEVDGKPLLATNRGSGSVADALRSFLTEAAARLSGEVGADIATAYFNVGGYTELADALDGIEKVRLLLGAEPDDIRRPRVLRGEDAQSVQPAKAKQRKIERALDEQRSSIEDDRNLLGFTVEADASAERLVAWLESGKVDVRRLQTRFLHGKAFLVGTFKHGVVAGSSNFTRAGLTTNAELNLGNYNPQTVEQVQDWYDEYWDEAEPYDLAEVFKQRFLPHDPQLIYLRMLWERYRDELNEQDAAGAGLSLTDFQTDGLWRAKRILQKYSGVLVADEVGLGKTFIAGELIREATVERRQRALVIAPATLRDGTWESFKSEHNLNVELRSYEDLRGDNRLNPEGRHSSGPKLTAEPDQYALIVLDEAHNARNPWTQTADALRRLLAGSPPKQLVLLTATPVNNSLWDLYYLLDYFMANDGAFADVGILSLRDHFAWAMRQDPDDLSPQHLFDVIEPVTVRRTRRFVKKNYANDRIEIDGIEQPITFPTPRVRRVDYDFDAVLPGFFQRFANALDPDRGGEEGALTLARYTPSNYLKTGTAQSYEMQHAGLLRSSLLKRFESSPHAFANTCERLKESHDSFLSLLDKGRIAIGEALADWVATDSDDIDAVDSFFHRYKNVVDDAVDYDVGRLTVAVERDRDLLADFAAEARTVKRADDPTLEVVVDELVKIAQESETEGIGEEDTRNKRKVLIFSYYADTVGWIYDHLQEVVETDERLTAYRGRVASLTGSAGHSDEGGVGKRDVLWGFAPKTTGAPSGSDEDLYDIVVATDVLAEGVNLQQARHIINYDLPWNPMRLVQRHGRIDRIGSPHQEVFIRCVFPDAKLDNLLGLHERIRRKLRQAAVSVGVESDVIPKEPGAERVFTETREEIERLRREEAGIFEQAGYGRGALSGEEFRRELEKALEDPLPKEQVTSLPWGSGSGMAIAASSAAWQTGSDKTPPPAAGFVFCARVGDHDRVQFRYVEVDASGQVLNRVRSDADDASTGLTSDTLTCLANARPEADWKTERVLSDETHQLAYAAWAEAARDIEDAWRKGTDKKSFEPELAKAQRDAIKVLQDHAPEGLDLAGADAAVEKLQARLTQHRVRVLQTALKSKSDSPTEQAVEVLRVIEELGLERDIPPEPLPEITSDDVHLICWLALTPPAD